MKSGVPTFPAHFAGGWVFLNQNRESPTSIPQWQILPSPALP